MGNPISEEVFLNRARARFGEKFDYTGIVYKSFKTPIRIRCTIHPVKPISITPERHLQTNGGCRFCLRERRVQILERGYFLPAAEEMVVAPLPRPRVPAGTDSSAGT
jgi:hypothetical protein